MPEDKKTQEWTDESVEQVRQEAFMEGYRYAIEILKEHLVVKEKDKAK